MKQAVVEFKSVAPYSQSKHYEVEKLSGESNDDHEKRTWRKRMHVTDDGHVFIPPLSFANCVKESAKRMSIKIPGRGQKTYTKAFEAGLLVLEPLKLPVRAEDVPCDALFVPSDGIPGSGKRVTKHFPRIDEWAGVVTFHLLDDSVTREVFAATVQNAGNLVGLGRFRPARGGYYGRFSAEVREWISA